MPADRDRDLTSLLARLLDGAREALAGDGAAEARARLDAVRAAVERMVPRGAEGEEPGDPARLRAELRGLRAALEQAGAGGTAGGDLGRLGGALEGLIGWLESVESGRPGSGAEVDSIVAHLEETFGPMQAAEAAAEKEREARIRSGVRASISERLRQAGIKPSEDP